MTEPSTPEPEQKPKSIQDLISLIGTVTPTIIGASFLLSICYDYFFLKTLGLSFFDIPSQISDHIRSAILWIPKIAALTALMFIPIAILFTPSDSNSNSQQGNRSDGTNLIKYLFYLLTFWSLVFLSTITQILAFFILLAIAAYLHIRENTTHRTIVEKYFKYTILTISIFTISAFSANQDANEILLAKNHVLTITTKINDVVSEIKANGIRRFSEFSIIVDDNRRVIILPKDAILSTKNIKPVVIQESLVCELLKIMCAEKVTPPAKAASSP